MGGVEKKKKTKNGHNAGDLAQKKKRRRKEGSAIAKISEAPKEAVAQQVVPSLNLALNCADSASAVTQKKPKKRILKGFGLPSDEASTEKEKQSLLAWVEMCMEPLCNDNSMLNSLGDIEIGRSAKERSSNGHTCVGHDTSGRICNGDAFAAAHENGACDHLPNAHSFKLDHEGHVCVKKSLSNGHNSQSNHHTENCSLKVLDAQSLHEGPAAINSKECLTSQERSVPIGQSYRVPNGEISVVSHTFTHAYHGSNVSRSGETEWSCLVGGMDAYERGLYSGDAVRSGKDNLSCEISKKNSLLKENDSLSLSNNASPHNNKRKREDDKVLQYVLKRSIVLQPSPFEQSSNKSRTTKTVVIAWGRNIPVTLTSEACAVQEWISSQSGNLFGLDVEWRPNRAKGERNKVALLQLCNESECLIIQMLFLDKKPQALRKFLSDPSKGLAGVGVLADGNRLLHDYGLECQGGIELTTLAVERLKRDELRNVGLKVLVQEVLGLKMDKPKKVTLSNWAKVKLDPAQINYACMDAWASFALSRKLLVDM